MKVLDLDAVRAFVLVADLASFTRAADALGTTQSAIARLEGGRVSPSVATLRRYAEATGTTLQIDLVSR